MSYAILVLEHLMDARKLDGIKKVIIYIASHGSGARIGGEDGPGINLSTVFDRIARHQHSPASVVGAVPA